MTTNDTTFVAGQHVTVRMDGTDVHGIVYDTPEDRLPAHPNYVWVQTTRDSRPMKYRRSNVNS
jgi:hypothetical protein